MTTPTLTPYEQAQLDGLEKLFELAAAPAIAPPPARPASPAPARERRHRPRHRKPSAAQRAAVQARRTVAITTVAAIAATAVAVPVLAAGSGNVTASMGNDPRELDGDSYECTLTTPQMTAVDGSEAGNVRLFTHPGHLFLDVNKGGTPGHWNDAYLSAGVNPFGYDSTHCDGWGWGTSYKFPVLASKAGPLRLTIRLHTVAGFMGDGGVDMWLTPSHGKAPSGAPWTSGYVTAQDMQSSPQSAEIMVWTDSDGIYRGQYASLGWVKIQHRLWQVLYYDGHRAGHRWNYIVFAAPKVTSKATTTIDHNLELQPLIQFAMAHGLVPRHDELQAIDPGMEWYRDPTGGTQVTVSLSRVN